MLSPGGQILDDLGEVGVRGVSLGYVDPMGEVSHHLQITKGNKFKGNSDYDKNTEAIKRAWQLYFDEPLP